MNNQLKRAAACLLAVLCMFSLMSAAFADGEDGTGSVVAADGTTVNGAGESAQESDSIIDANTLKSKIDSYITEQGISGTNKVLSVGYCYTATGDTWYYDGDQWCYSASLYKVPCCMLLAEKEYKGEITADTQISTQYASGTVDYLEKKSIVNSDNYTGHAIVEYLGGTYNGKCSDQTIKYTDLPADYFPSDFTDYSYYSAKYYTQVLKTLYSNSDQYPRIMDYMKQDQSYHYLDQNLEGKYEVAQKYGAFEEKNGNKNYHSAGIVYTPNPVIITILTKNITNFEKHIGAIAKILVDYTLELDSQLATFNANKLAAQQQEAARLAQEEQQRLAQEAAAQQAAAAATPTVQPVATQAPVTDTATSIFLDATPTPASQQTSQSGGLSNVLSNFSLPVIAGLALIVVIFIVVFVIKLRNSKLEEEEFDEEDYEEYARGNLSDLAPRQDKKKTSLMEKLAKKDDRFSDEEYEDEYEDYNEKYVDHFDKKNKSASTSGTLSRKIGKRDSYADESYEDDEPQNYKDSLARKTYSGEKYDDNAYINNAYEDNAYDDNTYDDSIYDDDVKEYAVVKDHFAEKYIDSYPETKADDLPDEEYVPEENDSYEDDSYEDDYPGQTVSAARAEKRTSAADRIKSRFSGIDIQRQNRKAHSASFRDDEEEEQDSDLPLTDDTVYDRTVSYDDEEEYSAGVGRVSSGRSFDRFSASRSSRSVNDFDSDYEYDPDSSTDDDEKKPQSRSSRFGRSSRNGYTPKH